MKRRTAQFRKNRLAALSNPRLEQLEVRCLFSALALDPSFASGGLYINQFQQAGSDSAGTSVLANGKILVTGSAIVNDGPDGSAINNGVLLRLNADGSLDTSFGVDGANLDPNGSDAAIAVASNGDIYVAGTESATGNSPAIKRDHADGTLDTSFGNQGIAVGAGTGQYAAIAIESNGKIAAVGEGQTGGQIDQGDILVAQFNSDGTADASFGTGGTVTLNFGDTTAKGYQNSAASISIDANGKILVGGSVVNYVNESTNTGSFVVARLNADGTPDTSFGDQGHVLTSFHTDLDTTDWITFDRATLTSVFAEGDGKVLAIGVGWEDQIIAARYNADGSLDTTFADGGKMLATGNGSINNTAELLPDGGFVVAGAAFANPGAPVAWEKFDQNGTAIDSASSAINWTQSQSIPGAAFTSDGSLIVVGWEASGNMEVAKFQVTGDPVAPPPVDVPVDTPVAGPVISDPGPGTSPVMSGSQFLMTSGDPIPVFIANPADSSQQQRFVLASAATVAPGRFDGAKQAAAGGVYHFKVTFHSSNTASITLADVPAVTIDSPNNGSDPGFTATATAASSQPHNGGRALTVTYTVQMPTDASANGFHTVQIGTRVLHTFIGHGGTNVIGSPGLTVVHANGPSHVKAGATFHLTITYASTTGAPLTAADLPNSEVYSSVGADFIFTGSTGADPRRSADGHQLTLTYTLTAPQTTNGVRVIETNGQIIHKFTTFGAESPVSGITFSISISQSE